LRQVDSAASDGSRIMRHGNFLEDKALAAAQQASAGVIERQQVDARLELLLPPSNIYRDGLAEAVRFASLAQGKRVRPVLAMLSAAHFGGAPADALDFGCALELIHTASLILDDLPCMDDAAMRRGRPTVHRQFGEDTAVLSAVALLNHGFGIVAEDTRLGAEMRLSLMRLVRDAVGFDGLVSGQMRDLRDTATDRNEASLTSLNRQKTGGLFVAAAVGGAVIAGAGDADVQAASAFGDRLGLAFQLRDDLQDLTSTLEVMGKDVLQDRDRVTLVTLRGPDRSRIEIGNTLQSALAALGERRSALGVFVLNLFNTI
jgi:geranylgeranyl diphosphate synthase type II